MRKRCWGCDRWFHRDCALGDHWGPGPTHCEECWVWFRERGIREVALDPELMYRVVVGVADPRAKPAGRDRCDAAS